MTALRTLLFVVSMGLAAAPYAELCGADPGGPRSIAPDVPAFEAPEKPSREPTGPQLVEPEGPLSLQDALALALMGNPSLAAFSWEVRASEARELQAGTPRNPEIDFRYYRLRDNQPVPADDEARRRVILSQVFELGGKRRRRIELARSERDLASWDYEARRIEVATAVAGGFARVSGAERRVDSLRQTLEFFEGKRERVLALVQSGRLRGVEVHQVKRRVGLTRIDLQAAEAELRASRLLLASLWGSGSPRFTKTTGDLEQVRPLPDLETVLALARRGPSWARWEAELARGQAALSAARSLRVPDVTYGVGIRWENDFARRDYLLDLGISLPVFDRKQGEVLEARHDLARLQAERQAAEVERDRGVAEAYARLEEAHARRGTLADEVLPATRAAFDAYVVGFEQASENLDGLLDARRELAQAEADYTDSLVDYHHALAALETLVGQSLGETP